LGQARSTQRYPAKDAAAERALVERIKALAAKRPRFGQDRITALLRKRTPAPGGLKRWEERVEQETAGERAAPSVPAAPLLYQ